MSKASELRPSPIAGLWYSGDPKQLGQEIDNYLSQASPPKLEGEVAAVIAPHAGYVYSGQTAGYAFRSVQGQQYDLVAVISPYHSYHPNPFLTSAHQAYATPLGTVQIDAQAVEALDQHLSQNAGAGLTAIANDKEHSLEIELPFLQQALTGSFQLLPVMMGTKAPQAIQDFGASLAHVLRSKSALMVASTDLSHFHPEPLAKEYDAEMLKQIEAFSPEGVLKADREGTGFACGAAAVAAVLWAARELGADKVEVVHHSTSGETSGDRESVVGYGAAVVLKQG
jgi:AmmeMemoRadiSam system protein B